MYQYTPGGTAPCNVQNPQIRVLRQWQGMDLASGPSPLGLRGSPELLLSRRFSTDTARRGNQAPARAH